MFVSLENLSEGLQHLADVDEDLKFIIQTEGAPPLWDRVPGFSTLVHIILEQQVSLASARATFEKLVELLPDLQPAQFLTLTDAVLRQTGFSRQKTRYVRGLAETICEGKLSLASLITQCDTSVREQLMQVTGIGTWTADIYLLMALRRADVWPVGDLALVRSVMDTKKMTSKPSADGTGRIAVTWRPWRSVAARVLWNHYIIHLTGRSVTT